MFLHFSLLKYAMFLHVREFQRLRNVFPRCVWRRLEPLQIRKSYIRVPEIKNANVIEKRQIQITAIFVNLYKKEEHLLSPFVLLVSL